MNEGMLLKADYKKRKQLLEEFYFDNFLKFYSYSLAIRVVQGSPYLVPLKIPREFRPRFGFNNRRFSGLMA